MGDSPNSRLDASQVPPSGVLNGWKAIAAHIGMSERTAQRYEKLLKLPVRRKQANAGGGVLAITRELDDWLQKPKKKWSRRTAITVAGLVVFVGVVGVWLLRLKTDLQPAGAVVSGNSLTVFGASGKILWEHRFPFPLNEEVYTAQAGPFESQGPIVIADLDNDKSPEIIVRVDTTGKPAEVQLYCFEGDGRERFRYVPRENVRFGDQQFGPPFTVRHLWVSKNRDDTADIWIGASHLQWYPTVVQRLDGRRLTAKRVISEYWTNGHIQLLKEVEIRDRRYIAVGGTSNENMNASLTLLDYANASGRAPSAVEDYRCHSCLQRDPVTYFQFPQMEVAKRMSTRPYVVEVNAEPNGGIIVTVLQAKVHPVMGTQSVTAYYRLDSNLRLVSAQIGDDYLRAWQYFDPAASGPKTSPVDLLPVLQWTGAAYERIYPLLKSPWPRQP